MIIDLIFPSFVAAAAVFFVSFHIWMFIRWHDKDILPLPDEAEFMDNMSDRNIPPGLYMWPNCQESEGHGSPEFQAKWKAGPWGSINILGGCPSFARNLIGSFLVNWAVAFAIAVSLGMVIMKCPDPASCVTCPTCQVFVPALILGAAAYCFGGLGNDLFLGKQCRFICTTMLDGVIYAAVNAAVLWWLWPTAG